MGGASTSLAGNLIMVVPSATVTHALSHGALWATITSGMHSQFFGGGAVLMVMGGVMAYFRALPGKIRAWAMRQITVDLKVYGYDPAFSWFLVWLNEQPYSKKTRTMSLHTSSDSKTVIFTPAAGSHFFRYKHRWVRLDRSSTPKNVGSSEKGGGGLSAASMFNPMQETMTIEVLGRSQQCLRDLVEDARQAYFAALTDEIHLHRPSWNYWQQTCALKNRPMDSVILPPGTTERLVADISAFLKGAEWYRRRGIPYRRGYLFHGLPGTGKSSLVQAVACALNLPLYALNIGSKNMSDDSLEHLFTALPERCILLMEDVDAAVRSTTSVVAVRKTSPDQPALEPSSESGKKDAPEHITLSGLLNVLDGVGAAEGRVVIMTTNHRGALDPALIRPGRIDLEFEFCRATYAQARTLFARFYDLAPDSPILADLPEAVDGYFTMAELQGIMLMHRENALDGLRALCTQFLKSQNETTARRPHSSSRQAR